MLPSEADLTDCACYTAINGLVSHVSLSSYWTLPFIPSIWYYSSTISLMSFPKTYRGSGSGGCFLAMDEVNAEVVYGLHRRVMLQN